MATGRLLVALVLAAASAASAPYAIAAPSVRPAEHRSGSIGGDDYPASALRDKAQGTSVLRHLVGADGRVRGCEIIGSSGNAALDSTACRLSHRRFRYTPARDGAGGPIQQWRTYRQVWSLPEAARAVPGPKPASD